MYIHEFNTLAEAAAWLSQTTGDDWTERQIIDQGAKGEINLLLKNPNWERFGVGEPSLFDDSGPLPDIVTDGLIPLESGSLRTLLIHGRAQISTLPNYAESSVKRIIVDTPLSFDASHVRVLKEELVRVASSSANASKVGAREESPAERSKRIKSRCDELKTNGVRAFLEVVAREENLSVSMIKKLRSRAGAATPKAGTIDGLKVFKQK